MTHVTREDCRRMRDLHERGYWTWLIAEQMDVHKDTVNYHIHGHCSHQHDE